MDLTTDRLVLRRWRAGDLDPYAQLCADPDVMRYIGDGSTLSRADVELQIERFEAQWERYGYGLWAVETRSDGTFVGFAGLARPTFLPEVMPAVELGWRFARSQWGQGFATESGRAALRVAFDDVGLDRVIGIVDDGNVASWHVMEKLGLSVERTTVHPQYGTALRVYEKAAPAGTG